MVVRIMKRFNITVNGKAYDVTVEEVGGAAPAAPVKAASPAPAPAAAPAAPAAPAAKAFAPGSAGEVKLHDVPDRTAAMLMAIVADKMGKPLNELRFLSIREIK